MKINKILCVIMSFMLCHEAWGAMPAGYTWRTTTNGVTTAFTALSTSYRCAIGVAWNSTERTNSNDPSAIGAGIPTSFQGSFVIPNILSDYGYMVTEVGYKAFYNCTGMTSVSIPNTITFIDYSAFSGCTGLTSVVIPSSVTQMDWYTFWGCTNLKTVVLNNGLKTIGKRDFYNCTSLTSINIPSSVTSIGSKAFGYDYSTKLTSVTVNWETPISIYSDETNMPFPNAKNSTLYVPKGTVELYANANGWKDFKEIKEHPIQFADANVKALCIANWDTDGDGELSEDEAAAVTNIGTVFQNQTEITSFSEFKFFSGVTTIGQYALSGCTNLATIEFPSNLQSFDRYACYNSGFENIVIPENVTSIGNSAFRNCTALSTIKFGENSVSFGKNVFRSCTSLTSITFDGTECQFNGEDAFRDCNALTSVVITDVSAWCKSSFTYSSSNPLSKTKSLLLQTADNGISVIKDLVIPDDITVINSNTFCMCESLESVVIPSCVTSIGAYAFYGCNGLTSVDIPNSMTSIGTYAFYGCNSLTSVDIPNSVTSIGDYVFRGCSSLISIVIPNSVTSIGAGAFYECTGLTFVAIPQSVTSIGNYAFSGCSNLTSVTAEMTEPINIGTLVFSNSANATLYVPAGCKAAYEAANSWKQFKEIVEMPSQLNNGDVFTAKTLENIDMTFKVISVTDKTCQVGNGNGSAAISTSYEGNLTIPSVVYGYRVKSISYRSLRQTNITSVVIPNGVEIIETEAFEQCHKLTSIYLPDGIETIGAEAFKTCSILETARIPRSLKTIYSEVFKNCYKLHTVDFEDGITSLGSYMFENCSSLVSVELPNSIESIGNGAFSSCSSLSEIALPQGTSYIGSYAFSGCTALASFDIPSAITSIENSAFRGCTKLSSIVIPEGVTTIGTSAFYGCTDLLSIDFPNTLESIGSQAFHNTKWYDNQPDGVIYIGNIAYCYKGTMPENTIVSIAEGTIGISPYAFRSFGNLVEVDIPESVASIGSWCFNGCNNLKTVKVSMTTPLVIDDGTFSNRENALLYVPDGCVDIYSKANVWKDFLSIKQLSDPEMFSGGDGTETNPYIINTVGDMKVLAKNVNNGTTYAGIFFKVGKPEIDFSGVTPIPIGTITGINQTGSGPYYLGNAFSGTLDGNDAIIKNWSSNNGLFLNLGKNGVVKNIIMDATCVISGSGNVGGIAGVNEGNISNCTNYASISSTVYHIGGICGDNMGIITYCKNYGYIIGKETQYDSTSGSMIGGIAGDSDGGQTNNLHNTIISYCENYGSVSSPTFEAGGIVGLATGNYGQLEGCSNFGDVTGKYSVGGVIGNITNQTMVVHNNFVTNCNITGTSTSSSRGAGAIAGTYNTYFSNNYYTQDVVVKVDANTYEASVPRGVWGGYEPKDVTANNGAVLLKAGDINGDNVVDVSDYIGVANHILGDTPAGFNALAADVNGDHVIDISDYIGIANIILTGSIYGNNAGSRPFVEDEEPTHEPQ